MSCGHGCQIGQALTQSAVNALLVPYFHNPNKIPRYYQRIAIDRAVQAILQGKRRALLTLATGTGKTSVAFQICWKLWSQSGTPRRAVRSRVSCSWPTATSWSTTPRTRTSLRSVTPVTRSKVARPVKAGRCTSPSIRPSPRTNTGLAFKSEFAPDFFDLIMSTNVIEAVPRMRATGGKSSNISSRPFRWG